MAPAWKQGPEPRSFNSEMGHAAIVDADTGGTLLSQFPAPAGMHGQNFVMDFPDVMDEEKRDPDSIFKVHVPNDAAFDKAVADHTGRPNWDWWSAKKNKKNTNCVHATTDALNKGGVPVDDDYYWPGNLGKLWTS